MGCQGDQPRWDCCQQVRGYAWGQSLARLDHNATKRGVWTNVGYEGKSKSFGKECGTDTMDNKTHGRHQITFNGKVGKGRGKKRQEIHIVKVTAEKKSLLVRLQAACQCVWECVLMCMWTYWSLEFAVFWHSCSRLQSLSGSEHPPLEPLYLRDRAKLHWLQICTALIF